MISTENKRTVISTNRSGKQKTIYTFYELRNDTKFYICSYSKHSLNNQRFLAFCLFLAIAEFLLVIPIFTWNYGFLLKTKYNSLQPEILGNRTNWQAEDFFNLQILQARRQKLIRKRACKS